jgi:hypothetical protein
MLAAITKSSKETVFFSAADLNFLICKMAAKRFRMRQRETLAKKKASLADSAPP